MVCKKGKKEGKIREKMKKLDDLEGKKHPFKKPISH